MSDELRKDGGSIFPQKGSEWLGESGYQYIMPHPGLTILQFYQGMALAGFIAHDALRSEGMEAIAPACHHAAEKMLKFDEDRARHELWLEAQERKRKGEGIWATGDSPDQEEGDR
jgi:hypothetical protein